MQPVSGKKAEKPYRSQRGRRGFVQTGGLLKTDIRGATEKRGFAETRLLTQWAEIAGTSTAAIATPVKVGYTTQGIGATLTLLCKGANAPMLQMQLPQILKRVNACYGYNAISRIKITQTAPTGFGEGAAAAFTHKPAARKLSPEQSQRLAKNVGEVEDDSLRLALEKLGQNILTRPNSNPSKD